jgi:hypothetical protein
LAFIIGVMEWAVAVAAAVVMVGVIAYWRRSAGAGSGRAKSSAQIRIEKENEAYLRDWQTEVPPRAQRDEATAGSTSGAGTVVPYHWGRYKQPLTLPDVAAPSWRLKRWNYNSINNGARFCVDFISVVFHFF